MHEKRVALPDMQCRGHSKMNIVPNSKLNASSSFDYR